MVDRGDDVAGRNRVVKRVGGELVGSTEDQPLLDTATKKNAKPHWGQWSRPAFLLIRGMRHLAHDRHQGRIEQTTVVQVLE